MPAGSVSNRKAWIASLAALSAPDLAAALQYNAEQDSGHGPAPTVVLRRLTHSQYNHTVRDLLREATTPARLFPTEDFVNGFRNQYQAQIVSPLQAEAYATAAERLALNAFRRGDSRGLIPCAEADPSCPAKFVRTFGRHAFRRPLEKEEIARYEALFRAQKDFLPGARAVIETMLQSPGFLYWLDSTPNESWKPYATASRLSYFLWDTMPDDALLDSAARGELNSPEGLDRVTRRLLADPRARQGLDEFVSQWLRFDRALGAAREPRLFPLFNHELALAMTEETRQFVADLVWNDRNFMEVFSARHSFINSDLAAVYKVTAASRDFNRVEFPPEAERAGILGQALLLTLTSKPDDTAPTGRGLFVRQQFLCQQVPDPPPGVDTNLPPVAESKPMTNRERLAAHTTNPMCAGCHSLMDPIGFGFEKFDAIGARREKARLLFPAANPDKEVIVDLELDTTGSIAGIRDSRFTSPRQLGDLLARTPQCQECVVKQVFRYMAGRRETPADRPLLVSAAGDFRKSGFRFREMLRSLVTGREFPAGKDAHAERHHPAP
ncbi:MAG: DUF1592 domain-containing protein [Acidobacteria bacterium]|nr:DUF1592 domain-containing protein [Acidobacteriota bacterium]